jgi:hypothetical protein
MMVDNLTIELVTDAAREWVEENDCPATVYRLAGGGFSWAPGDDGDSPDACLVVKPFHSRKQGR